MFSVISQTLKTGLQIIRACAQRRGDYTFPAPMPPHHSIHLTTSSIYRIAVGCFYFMSGLIFASWASRIPDIQNRLELNPAALGGVLLVIPLGQMTAMALSGMAVSRFGSRRTLLTASLLYPLILVLLGMAPSITSLSAGLFFFGMAGNLYNISVNTQGVGVERLYGKRSIMARFHGLWSVAGFIAGLVSTWMVVHDLDPKAHFIIILVFSLALTAAAFRFTLPRDQKPPQQQEKRKKRSFKMPDKGIFLLGLIAFGSMACEGTMFDWSSVYFEKVVNPGRDLIRVGYIGFMCTMAGGRFAADALITRFGAASILRTSGIIIFAGLLLAVLQPSLVPATIGFLLVGFGTSSIVPICYSLAGKSKTMRPGSAIASVSTIGFLGFLMVPPLIGFIAQASSLRHSFAFIAAIGLMTSILAPLVGKSKKPTDSDKI